MNEIIYYEVINELNSEIEHLSRKLADANMKLLAHELVNVQPMSCNTAQIFTSRHRTNAQRFDEAMKVLGE